MKWRKQFSDLWDDEGVARLLERRGMEGYGLLVRVMDIVAAAMAYETQKCSVRYDITRWSNLLSIRGSHLRKKMRDLRVTRWVTVKCIGNDIEVTIQKLLELRDEWHSRLGSKSRAARELTTEAEAEVEQRRNRTTTPEHASLSSAKSVPPPTRQSAPPELSQGLRKLVAEFDGGAGAQFWAKCRVRAPDCTVEEVLNIANLKLNEANGKIKNPVGFLMTVVPPRLEDDGTAQLRAGLQARATPMQEQAWPVQVEVESDQALEAKLEQLPEAERDALRQEITADLKRSGYWERWTSEVREKTVHRKMLSRLHELTHFKPE